MKVDVEVSDFGDRPSRIILMLKETISENNFKKQSQCGKGIGAVLSNRHIEGVGAVRDNVVVFFAQFV